MNNSLQKVVIILGPTACGKTDWSLRLAKTYNGEVVSADSRQIYKKMDIGTAKVIGDWRWNVSWNGLRRSYYVEDVPHHLMDFLDPGKSFSSAEFRDRAVKYIKMATRHGKIPFVVGGTGLYISSLVNNFYIPRIPPNKKLRSGLEEKSHEELMELLKRLDKETASNIDQKNKRRIIRALEVSIMTGEKFSRQKKKGEKMFDFLQIGIDVERDILYDRINKRVDAMIEDGLLQEIEALLKQKYSWKLPSMSGIGYRQFQLYYDGEQSLEKTVELLKRDTRRYARRQLTWFRRDKGIVWCKSYEEAEALVQKFLQ
ncbi:MAG: tRNA (adenosine(37)-N6)-dimethylallyltransferase MiaA [Candidatus Magasanikbacteria bacterium CG11_big_fil_rev_8_21_14_0_20_39_34]|uniref:tRNA dimethylallyltransferase n=1 Tax=Candidatus Magasanikbacteria bacterium CG11_big_fil_rev_8_21_14_0_20_39_34 TaxID=1974653 RepID=A0A2H0N6A7_9BACT|nr:MAG: tRNA (adenosine(37)-N6)-dimethylallyltransferase MiaA [Candidatus Magasanikbacteria bacterium CG11_big_fil_rev_8_21_14_0_20_39_34]